MSKGNQLRRLLERESPLAIVGTVNAYCAIMAQASGAQAIYLSGGALSAVSCGLPDLGFIGLNDVLIDASRITRVVDLPLIVDADTGFEADGGLYTTTKSLIACGVAAIQIEDQISQKRCGHRPNKQLVDQTLMCDRIERADHIRQQIDPDFYIIARTDALASEGLAQSIARSKAYVASGADAIFAEACSTLDEYQAFVRALDVPILANITEFGQTPLFTLDELQSVGVRMALYPFTATRLMNQAALQGYQEIICKGTQKNMLDRMQTREELYGFLDYHQYERDLDESLGD